MIKYNIQSLNNPTGTQTARRLAAHLQTRRRLPRRRQQLLRAARLRLQPTRHVSEVTSPNIGLSKAILRPAACSIHVSASRCLCAGPLGFSGCSEPKFYPTRGKIILYGVGPLTEGEIRFRPVSKPSLVASGQIQKDGTFSVSTARPRRRRPRRRLRSRHHRRAEKWKARNRRALWRLCDFRFAIHHRTAR